MTDQPAFARAERGLCGQCSHAIVRPTRRGTVYLRCALAASDSRFAKYPRLPVTECAGFRPAAREPADGGQGSW
ncbi:MAG: hypothetical protein QOH89_3445 [Pseudonocardiales bacterium]|jgi:hypothetical protein|nr:hypothetical protein [Pseudonocardiales bacterium]